MNDAFVQYLNNEDVHDGVIRRVSEEAGLLRVFVETADSRVVVFEFNGVRQWNSAQQKIESARRLGFGHRLGKSRPTTAAHLDIQSKDCQRVLIILA